jgi:hypothetical protein
MFVKAVLALLTIPAAILAAVLTYALVSSPTLTPMPPGERGALVWDDGRVIFSDKHQVEAWLRLHGGSVVAFRKQHPAAIRLLSPAPKKARAAAAARPTHRRTPTRPAPATPAFLRPPASTSSALMRDLGIGLGALGALVLLAILFVPARVGRLHLSRPSHS